MTGRRSHAVRAAVLAVDVAAAACASVAAYVVRFHVADRWFAVTGRTDVLPERYLAAFPAAVLLLVLANAAAGLYDSRRADSSITAADALRVGALASLTLAAVTLVVWREFQYSRLTILIAAWLHALACVAFRRAAVAATRRAGARDAALLIGGGEPAARLVRALRDGPDASMIIDACLPVGSAAPPGAAVLATIDEAVDGLARGRWRDVYVCVPAASAAEVPAILDRLAQTTADVHLAPDLGDAILMNASARIVAGQPLISIRERPMYGVRAAVKRCTDVVVSALLLVAGSPLLVLLWALVRATSAGPALFGQDRMGLDGRSFRMWKFRTMRTDAETATGPVFARPGDPRVTPVGRVLRRLSLDELPQLWNVLRGEMSLVGPRPERAPFIEEFRRRLPGYMLRHTVKAGMTGWAQVHGLRGDSSLEDRLRYDLEYVDRWSLTLDVEILARTAVQVLVGRNAY